MGETAPVVLAAVAAAALALLALAALRAGRTRRIDLDRREQRVSDREERLDERGRGLDQRAVDLADREAGLAARGQDLDRLTDERRAALEAVAGLSAADVHAQLVASVEADARRSAALTVREVERAAREEGDRRAREVVVGAVQRVASAQTAESVVASVALLGEDIKGRIIGREGRNIRTFESVTGTNLIVDETPDAVLVSCFDPVRRETARATLEALVLDGRIHPQRIEDAYRQACTEVEARCQRSAEDALLEVGITDLHPELVRHLGLLRFRTSYGQNVLAHVVETAQLAGLMAAELGADPAQLRRCGLLHDIGKALTHEADGSHAAVGAELARRCGEHEDVVHAIEAHHGEVTPRTVEALLTQAADAVSGSRPGARREPLESYVTRMHRLEEIAGSYPGVERAFAMQAGRDLRVMVLPDVVDDVGAQVLAREIAKQVEHDLTYPGQVKVTVVRESRATEVAH
ncbi:MAG: ribonuclease Y [Sporichthyaceae bacterium]